MLKTPALRSDEALPLALLKCLVGMDDIVSWIIVTSRRPSAGPTDTPIYRLEARQPAVALG